ncbi:cell division protein FtsQ/DivIB [Demequina sediminicola]|uniref:cell division protein FtsQ/DivIB n=1 Tax=Demequina sediminicola TaxID=1095026 RepID=UPI0007840793|nr:cell division protein FtsQ/DivIB [Demequina sediminicola]
MEERLREKRSVERRAAGLKWGKRGAIAGVGLAGAGMVLMSPLLEFDAADVEASGFGTVVDQADVTHILEGYDGTALATLNTGRVEAQLGELVGVSDAQVVRVWPSGLRVTLTPSEPVAAIPLEEGFALLTDTGEQVSESAEAPANLPVVSVPVGEENERVLSGVLGVLEQVSPDLRSRIQNVEASTQDDIHFVLRDGPRVEWGNVSDSALKAEVLAAMLKGANGEGVTVIDVSAPTLPTVVSD